ncbi:MAG: phosphatase PAP2 family protein [Xanthobacteraceae bacterium]
MTDLQKWLIFLGVTVAGVVVSYLWLDQPIAFFVHDHVRQFSIFSKITQFPELIAPFAGALLLALGLLALAGRSMAKPQTTIFLCGLSLIVAGAIKTELKYVFGRTWPETWVRNNPSLIHDGVYGFNPFHEGIAYSSFPSGHTAATCALMSVLWICYPRYWPLYLAAILAVSIGLVGADYHFLSDVIAGIFVGTSTGWMLVAAWNTGFRRAASDAAQAETRA